MPRKATYGRATLDIQRCPNNCELGALPIIERVLLNVRLPDLKTPDKHHTAQFHIAPGSQTGLGRYPRSIERISSCYVKLHYLTYTFVGKKIYIVDPKVRHAKYPKNGKL
jgi:hypothetical protein